VDLPELILSIREGKVVRKYFVGDDVSGEESNPDLRAVARVAIFARSIFQSRKALDLEKWLAPLVESDESSHNQGQANDQMQRTRPAQAIEPRR
jgi:hypothetical protein